MKQITGECWLWAGTINNRGYGDISMKIDGVWRIRRAHRVVYEALVGEIPEGLVIDHVCREKACVNPDHLEAVTEKENILRGIGSTSVNARKTECIRGHKYTPENTRMNRGSRNCKTCIKHFAYEKYAKKLAKEGKARQLPSRSPVAHLYQS